MSVDRWDLDWEPPPKPVALVKKKGKGKPVRSKLAKPPAGPKLFRVLTYGDLSNKGFATVDESKKYAVDSYGNDWTEPVYIVRVVAVGMPGITWTEEAA